MTELYQLPLDQILSHEYTQEQYNDMMVYFASFDFTHVDAPHSVKIELLLDKIRVNSDFERWSHFFL